MLRFYPVNHRMHTFLLYPRQTPNSPKCLSRLSHPLKSLHSPYSKPLPSRLNQIPPLIRPGPPHLPPKHPANPPVLDLRRPLQLLLFTPKPNPLPLLLHRDRSRHRRRAPHPHRPPLRRPLIPTNRPLQVLPPLHQGRLSDRLLQLLDLHLGAAESHAGVSVPDIEFARSGELRACACGPGVFGRDFVSVGAGGREHGLLDWRTVARRVVYHCGECSEGG